MHNKNINTISSWEGFQAAIYSSDPISFSSKVKVRTTPTQELNIIEASSTAPAKIFSGKKVAKLQERASVRFGFEEWYGDTQKTKKSLLGYSKTSENLYNFVLAVKGRKVANDLLVHEEFKKSFWTKKEMKKLQKKVEALLLKEKMLMASSLEDLHSLQEEMQTICLSKGDRACFLEDFTQKYAKIDRKSQRKALLEGRSVQFDVVETLEPVSGISDIKGKFLLSEDLLEGEYTKNHSRKAGKSVSYEDITCEIFQKRFARSIAHIALCILLLEGKKYILAKEIVDYGVLIVKEGATCSMLSTLQFSAENFPQDLRLEIDDKIQALTEEIIRKKEQYPSWVFFLNLEDPYLYALTSIDQAKNGMTHC